MRVIYILKSIYFMEVFGYTFFDIVPFTIFIVNIVYTFLVQFNDQKINLKIKLLP